MKYDFTKAVLIGKIVKTSFLKFARIMFSFAFKLCQILDQTILFFIRQGMGLLLQICKFYLTITIFLS